MAKRSDFLGWVLEALEELGGKGTIPKVAEKIWIKHENEIRASGDLLYKWQYEMRWAAQQLRDKGFLVPANIAPRGIWIINREK